MLEKIVVCDCLLDISFNIFDEVLPHDPKRFYVIDQFKDIVSNGIFSSENGRFYIDLAACCVDFYDFSVNNIDIKDYDTVFMLNCVHTWHYYDNDSDSHLYGSLNDSDSVDSQDIENYFRQNNDFFENGYEQELGIEFNDDNDNDNNKNALKSLQRRKKLVCKIKKHDEIRFPL